MRIGLPVHLRSVRGIGTVVRGLEAALPDALALDDELVLVGGDRSRLTRPFYEQLVLPLEVRGVDLVHLCDHRPLLASRRPFIVTVHDLFFLDHPEWLPRSVVAYKTAMFRRLVSKRPRRFVCVSEYTRNRLLEHVPSLAQTSVEVVHSGVAKRPPMDVPPASERFVLTVGAIEPRKNQLTLLAAFQQARRRGFGLRWKVVGPAVDRSRTIIERLRVADGVDYLGAVSASELEQLYAQAEIFAVASHAEGFGFPPLEAMARGVPTICSTGSALDETTDGAAIRVDPSDVDGWADALLRLEYDVAGRERLRSLGRARAAVFSLEAMAAAYVRCYRSAV
jgi:alpha-1,3-rhamnosyl/mannosyltransferase